MFKIFNKKQNEATEFREKVNALSELYNIKEGDKVWLYDDYETLEDGTQVMTIRGGEYIVDRDLLISILFQRSLKWKKL